MIGAVCFDVDATLVDYEASTRAGLRELLQVVARLAQLDALAQHRQIERSAERHDPQSVDESNQRADAEHRRHRVDQCGVRALQQSGAENAAQTDGPRQR